VPTHLGALPLEQPSSSSEDKHYYIITCPPRLCPITCMFFLVAPVSDSRALINFAMILPTLADLTAGDVKMGFIDVDDQSTLNILQSSYK